MKRHCRETLERAYLFLDGELLSDHERREIAAHLEECRPCYERYGVEAQVTAVVARVKGCARCPDALRTRISALIREV